MIPDLDTIPEAVRRESAFALTLGAGLLGAAGAALALPRDGIPLVMLVGLGLTAWVTTRSDVKNLVFQSALGAAASLALAIAATTQLDPRSLILPLPWIAPVAAALVALQLSLMSQLTTYVEARSHEDGALAQLVASRWLLLVALISCLLAALIRNLGLGVSGMLVALFAAVRWALARDRLTTGRQWLEHVHGGHAIAWRVVDPSPFEELESLNLRPLVRGKPTDGVLVRDGSGGPYRGGIGSVPVALAPRAAWRESPGRWKLPGDVVPSLLMLWAFGVPFGALLFALALVGESLAMFAIGLAISMPCVVWASFLRRNRRKEIWTVGVIGFALSVLWYVLIDATRAALI